MKTTKILHFSDIHIGFSLKKLRPHKMLNKRAIGLMNLLRGRAKYFDDADIKVKALARFKKEYGIDIVINTGDYTALGLEHELEMARELVDEFMHPLHNYVTVPGNHDIYVLEADSHYRFSANFCNVLHSDMPQYCRKGHWPLVRLIGDNIAIIALNSSKPNPYPWRSDGHIPTIQLEALKDILQDNKIKDRFVFAITHYAPRLANGQPDKKLHGLDNSEEFLNICKDIKNGAVLFGHIHHTYRLKLDNLSSELFCAGSATMDGKEGAWMFEIDSDKNLTAKRLYWDGSKFSIKE
jgi:3',5'-cyclic AMP phosphodiesterase CpdA